MAIKQYRIGGSANGGGGNPFGLIGGIIMLVVGLIIGYFILTGLFKLLFILSPILLIAGIAVDQKGALKLGKSLVSLLKKNPTILIGLIVIYALTYGIGPFIFPGILAALSGGFLLSKYFIKKKIKQVFNQHIPNSSKEEDTEEFSEYEEVTDDEDEFLNLPPLEPKAEQKAEPNSGSTNEYDNMF